MIDATSQLDAASSFRARGVLKSDAATAPTRGHGPKMRADRGNGEPDHVARDCCVRCCHGCSHGDFLTGKKRCLLVRVGCAADVTEKRGEKDPRPFILAEVEAIGQPGGDDAYAHRRLGLLAMPEVRDHGQGRQDIRHPDPSSVRVVRS